MTKRGHGRVFFTRRPTALYLILVVILVVIVASLFLFGCQPSLVDFIPQGESDNDTDVDETVEQTAQALDTVAPTQVPPTSTSEPTTMPTATPTPTPLPTSTPTPLPTATPTPRIVSEAWFFDFMYTNFEYASCGTFSGLALLRRGWGFNDGEEWSDAYPCIETSCIVSYTVQNSILRSAFAENNDANYWCDWMCRGVANDFGAHYLSRGFNVLFYMENYGNSGTEPYCPQFDVEAIGQSDCNNGDGQVTEIPSISLGWSEEIRVRIEEEYLIPIFEAGWWGFPKIRDDGTYVQWNVEDTSLLSDNHVCYAIANGHYWFGFPEYYPLDDEMGWHLYDGLRRQLREKIYNELGVSVDGNPPLCPNFLEMIEPANIP